MTTEQWLKAYVKAINETLTWVARVFVSRTVCIDLTYKVITDERGQQSKRYEYDVYQVQRFTLTMTPSTPIYHGRYNTTDLGDALAFAILLAVNLKELDLEPETLCPSALSAALRSPDNHSAAGQPA